MAYLIGIDIGTSGTKTLLIDHEGRAVAKATAEYPLSTPRPGWAEQDPEDWWRATVQTCQEVLRKAGVSAKEVSGIGLSGQMHGSVFLDACGQVIRPCLLWCDQRTAPQCEWMTEKVGRQALVEQTCNPVLTGFTAPKILWVRDNEPSNYDRIVKVLLPKDYIRYRLTGEFATEVSDASGTSLFDVKQRQWAYPVLDKIGVPKEWMPEAFESQVVSGRVSESAASETGLAAGTPVVGGGGDQAAGAVGNGIVKPGIVSSTVGTSGVVFAFAERPAVDPNLRVHTFCHAVPGKWHVMGVMLSAGGSLRWYRDALASEEVAVARALRKDPYDVLSGEAANAPAGCEGLICLPYLTGERTPYPDPDARGVFFGISLRHGREHFARAVMEGVAYGLRDSFEIFREMGVEMRQIRASGGGARSDLWRRIQADVSGLEHVTINVDEGPAFGVALLAGVGTGVYGSVEQACEATIQVVSRTPPTADAGTYSKYYRVYRGLYPAVRELFRENAAVVAEVSE